MENEESRESGLDKSPEAKAIGLKWRLLKQAKRNVSNAICEKRVLRSLMLLTEYERIPLIPHRVRKKYPKTAEAILLRRS